MKPEQNQNREDNYRQKSKAVDITMPELKVDYKAVVTKKACYWHKNIHMNQ